MLFTVMITATIPNTFLKNAVDSVLSQTLCNEEYEIIVIKNYKEEYLDKYLNSHNVINLFTEKTQLGEKIAMGIQYAKGDIISLLDYDDLFYPTKLYYVKETFSRFPELIYYHNNFRSIYTNQEKVQNSKDNEIIEDGFYFEGEKFVNLRKKIVPYRADFNNSCISVKKEIILLYLDFIKKIEISLDQALFYICLELDRGLFLDNRVLTNYRIHDLNTSLVGNDRLVLENDEEKKMNTYERKRLTDLNNLYSMISPSLKHFILEDITLIKLSACLRTKRRESLQSISSFEYFLYLRSGNYIKRCVVVIMCLLRKKSEFFNLIYIHFILRSDSTDDF